MGRSHAFPLRCFKDRKEIICDRITDIPNSECKALVDFYYSTNGDGWVKGFSGDIVANKPRLTGSLACDWYGLDCQLSHISQLALTTNNLS
jgi:hypothetical protein